MVNKPSLLKKKIVRLVSQSNRPLGPKEIASKLKINHNSTKVYCRQLVGLELLAQPDGLGTGYVTPAHIAKESGVYLEPFEVHRLKFEFRYNPKEGPPFLPMSSRVTYTTHRHRINKGLTDDYEFDGRTITVTEHENAGLVEIFCKCSNNPYLLDDFRRYVSWVQGLYPRIPVGQWRLRQIEFNWDRRDIRLEGITSMSMQAFENFWVQIYQKKEVVRVEGQLVTDIDLAGALEILIELNESIERKKMEMLL